MKDSSRKPVFDLTAKPTTGIKYRAKRSPTSAEKAVDTLLSALTLEKAVKLNHLYCEIFSKNHSLWLVFIRVKEELRLRQKVEEDNSIESNEPI